MQAEKEDQFGKQHKGWGSELSKRPGYPGCARTGLETALSALRREQMERKAVSVWDGESRGTGSYFL